MIDFINNLNSREKKLLLAVSALIFFIIFWMIISNLFGEFKISKQNLNKSKSDYEYPDPEAAKGSALRVQTDLPTAQSGRTLLLQTQTLPPVRNAFRQTG